MEMILRELLGLTNLLGAQTLYIYETMEVDIIRKNNGLIFRTFQIVTPRLKNLNYSQKLTVVGLISSLCKKHFPKKKGY